MARKPPTLGQRIARSRRARFLTQSQLAEAMGVTQSAVARWERDATTPALQHRRLLAAVLEVAPADLYEEAA